MADAGIPLVRRFPALSTIPRVALGTYPTPIDRVTLEDGRVLLLKRDDHSATPIGGNKVRGLEWLLGRVRAGDSVLTVGPLGSTHALATATYASALGARTTIVRWNQEMNAAATAVDRRMRSVARVIDARWVAAAYAIAGAIHATRDVRWIPAGGSLVLAILGHVNAGLELVEQVMANVSELPERVVVPFGTGGTAAGLALAFRIADVPTRVVAVRVAPRIIARRGRLMALSTAAARFIERATGERLPRVRRTDVDIEERFYGGTYGRVLANPPDSTALEALGIALDDTYSRKAFAAARRQAGRTMLWLTFDGRLLST